MIFKIDMNPFKATEVADVNDVSWQWLSDEVCYVEMDTIPESLEDVVAEHGEFLANEDAFDMRLDEKYEAQFY